LQFKRITEHTCLVYYHKLRTIHLNDNTTEGKCAKLTENCVDLITMEEMETTIQTLKSRKSPGSYRINNELYKHAPESSYIIFFNFLYVCWIYGDIPKEWRTTDVIPIHIKGDRNNPDNYRVISLLNTGYKIYTKVIAKRLTVIAKALLLEEQSRFRKGRSCMD